MREKGPYNGDPRPIPSYPGTQDLMVECIGECNINGIVRSEKARGLTRGQTKTIIKDLAQQGYYAIYPLLFQTMLKNSNISIS